MKTFVDVPQVTLYLSKDSFNNTYSIENVPTGTIFGLSISTLSKWGSDGSLVWSIIIPDQSYSLWSWKIVVANDDNIYLAGYEYRENLIDIPIQDLPVKIYKYDTTGQQLWNTEITNLSGGNLAIVDTLGVQNGKITLFSTQRLVLGNIRQAREALITVLDTSNGNELKTITDTNIDQFRQFKEIDNQGYWILAADKIIHYSTDGNQIENFITGNGVITYLRQPSGGVVFALDQLGGFFVATTVDGPLDADIQLTRYNSDFTVDWQRTLNNTGDDIPVQITYDSVLESVILRIGVQGSFNNTIEYQVLAEWDKFGQQKWLRTFSSLGGILTIEPADIIGAWELKTTAELGEGGGHYGVGNAIIIGP